LEMKKSMQPAKRGMHKDALGYQRYSDTNERVHPDLVKPTATTWTDKAMYNEKGDPMQASHDSRSDIWRIGDKAYTTSQLPKGWSTLKPDADKIPTIKNFREGSDIVNKQWMPATRKWKEVGRGSVSAYGSGNKVWANVFDRYEKQLKERGINRAEEQLANIRLSARTEGGLSSKALQTHLADMLGGHSKAIQEIERMASYGTLPQRIAINVNKFMEGEYTEEGKRAGLQFAFLHEKLVIKPKHEEINRKFNKISEQQGISPEMVLRMPQETMDISMMEPEDLINIKVNELDVFQREQLRSRLKTLGR